jgi:tripeptidyl-peptidase-2
MINVPAAWDYLKQKWQTELPDVAYHVTIDSLSGSPRGVYLRQPHETTVAHSLSVAVEPVWPMQDNPTTESQQAKIKFQRQFKLKSTCPAWVKVPSDFVLMSEGRSFKMDVDPRGLPPGLHTAQVLAVDTATPDAGPLFQVPVTVTVPLPNPSSEKTTIDFGDLTFGPAEVRRFFVVPPLGTTWMDVVLTDTREDTEDASAKLYALHTVQLLPHAAYRDFEEAKYYSMRPGQTNVASIPVQAGVTVEIVLGRYWSTLGRTGLRASLTYRGVRPVPDHATLACGDAGSLVRIIADIKDEKVAPLAKLSKWWTPLRPLEKPLLEPLDDERDEYPSHPRRIYQLVLTYEFTQDEKGSITPRVPLTQGVLYESALESQLIMVYDSNKKLLGTADAWPKSVTVPKGKITLRMQVRHDNPEKLEGLKEMPMWIERSLEKDIQLSAYSSREAMILGKGNFHKRILRKGNMSSVFFQEPPTPKLPSGCQTGDLLRGTFTLCSGETTLLGEGKRPKGFPFTYVVGPKPAKTSDPQTPEPVDERSVQEKLDEAIRDVKVSKLDSLTAKEKESGKFEELFDEFVKDYPKHLPLLMAKLRYLDSSAQRMEKLNDIVDSANAVLAEISEDELALHFGKIVDKDNPDANKLDKQLKEKKTFLLEALARSAKAHLDINTEVSHKVFDELIKRMKTWVDIEAEKFYMSIYFEREKRAGRYGSIVKTINKILSKDFKEKDFLYPLTKQSLMEERAVALEKLGYTPLLERDEKLRIVECPSKFAPF